jgi:hypothetical protein
MICGGKDGVSSITNITVVKKHSSRLVGVLGPKVAEKYFAVFGVETMPKPHVTILLASGARDIDWPAQVYKALVVVNYFMVTLIRCFETPWISSRSAHSSGLAIDGLE